MEFTILGERCSGTSWLTSLIKDNFQIKLVWTVGWKHFFAYQGFEEQVLNNQHIIYFGIVRNPVDYLMSFYKKPHHQSTDRRKDLKTFLLSEFYSIHTATNNPKCGQEIIIDRGVDGNRYKNIFEMRNEKCKFLFEKMPSLAKNYFFIKYEDLKKNPENILEKIQSKFNLTRKNQEFFIQKKYIHGDTILENEQCMENYKIDDDIQKIIFENLDCEIENKMGYTL